MSIVDQIKEDILLCRKNKWSVQGAFLNTLLSEIQMVGKDAGNRVSTDEEAKDVLLKFRKNAQQNLEFVDSRSNGDAEKDKDLRNKLLTEIDMINEYLPQALTKEFMTEIISDGCFEGYIQPNMGGVMKYFKENFSGQYDPKELSKLAQVLLSDK